MAFLQAGEGRRQFFGQGGEPFLAVPPVVFWLIGLMITVDISFLFLPLKLANYLESHLAVVPARYAQHTVGLLDWLGRGFSLVSYLLLHSSATGLAVDCLWILVFGSVVARRLGNALFLLLFAICGVASAVAYLALSPPSSGGLAGSGGAVLGLMAAGARMLPTIAHDNNSARPPLAPILSGRVLTFSIICVGLSAIYSGWLATGTNPTGWLVLAGGYVVGLVLAGPFDLVARNMAPNEPSSA